MADIMFSEEAFRMQAKRDGVTHISTGVAALKDGKILMVRRVASDFLGGNYELPGGGIDAGEAIVDGAFRELKEETGLVASKVVAIFDGFDYSTDRKPHVRQVNLVVEAKPGEVVLDSSEHDDHLWVDTNSIDKVYMSDDMRQCVRHAFKLIG